MAKYTYEIYDGNDSLYLSGVDDDEFFDTEEEAKEAGYETISNCDTGAEILNLSNPGDYPYDEHDFDDFYVEVIEVDD